MIQNSIKKKLVSAIIITSSILTTLVVILNYYVEYNNDLDNIETRSKQIEKSILPSLTNSVWNLDLNGISTQLKGISALEDVLYVEIKENKNQIFSEGNPTQALNSKTLLKTYPLIQEIENEKFNIGQIKIYFGLDNIQNKLLKKIAFFTAFQFLKTLILTILFFIIFQYFLVKHVDKITLYFKNFNIDSLNFTPIKLERTSANINGDELDEMCKNINTISERIVRNNALKNQIIKKQEHEIVFKNTLEKNELYLKKFSSINTVFENEIRNTFLLMEKSLNELAQNESNKNLDYIRSELNKFRYLLKSGQHVAQYKNDITTKVSLDQISTNLRSLSFELKILNENILNKDLKLNYKRFIQFFDLLKDDSNKKLIIDQIENKISFTIGFKKYLSPEDFDLSSIQQDETLLPICSLIANEEGWKIIVGEENIILLINS